ncbi:DUF433 domain-containing protein [Sphingomonas sp. PB4P5]|uniref:DUF433 domain-containing protein n=1 Tax=Parasphingomonas puruogangriensis TaxID=3096155 RepID=UPI002FCB2C01
MNWRDHIHSDPGILGGKPVVKGTRISVEIILDWLAAGWSEAEIFENYPRLSPDALKAVFAFSREIIAEQLYATVPKAA